MNIKSHFLGKIRKKKKKKKKKIKLLSAAPGMVNVKIHANVTSTG